MSRSPKRLNRRTQWRPLKKLFIIATEGEVTEPIYFNKFRGRNAAIIVKCLTGKNKSSPPAVLNRMRSFIRKEKLGKETEPWEAWLVVDKDQWTDQQLETLHAWSTKSNHYGFALSNPMFEYWLLLHFEDGTGISSAKDCLERLKNRWPKYTKKFNAPDIKPYMIEEAVHRAKARDNPACRKWPTEPGCTTVYRLVENILAALNNQ